MIRPIVKDAFFLSQKSTEATSEDAPVIQDLIDTLKFHKQECIGMAANMIGVLKCILIADTGAEYLIMVNPTIIRQSKPYTTQEGCLSLSSQRSTTRYEKIVVEYLDSTFHKKTRTFTGKTAQIIQHEMDHFEGILI